jgi:flagellar hook assembly protein FlgD
MINSLAVGPDNTVWVGTFGGLSRYIYDTVPGKGTFVQETDILPEEIEIISNYPNPFNPETTIEYSLAKAGFVNLDIYNITGQKVRTLGSRPMTPGTHAAIWDGTNDSGHAVSSGVYIARIVMGEKVAARSMMLVK